MSQPNPFDRPQQAYPHHQPQPMPEEIAYRQGYQTGYGKGYSDALKQSPNLGQSNEQTKQSNYSKLTWASLARFVSPENYQVLKNIQLTQDQTNRLHKLASSDLKNPRLATLLHFFLGGFGAGDYYLGRKKRAKIHALVTITIVILSFCFFIEIIDYLGLYLPGPSKILEEVRRDFIGFFDHLFLEEGPIRSLNPVDHSAKMQYHLISFLEGISELVVYISYPTWLTVLIIELLTIGDTTKEINASAIRNWLAQEGLTHAEPAEPVESGEAGASGESAESAEPSEPLEPSKSTKSNRQKSSATSLLDLMQQTAP